MRSNGLNQSSSADTVNFVGEAVEATFASGNGMVLGYNKNADALSRYDNIQSNAGHEQPDVARLDSNKNKNEKDKYTACTHDVSPRGAEGMGGVPVDLQPTERSTARCASGEMVVDHHSPRGSRRFERHQFDRQAF